MFFVIINTSLYFFIFTPILPVPCVLDFLICHFYMMYPMYVSSVAMSAFPCTTSNQTIYIGPRNLIEIAGTKISELMSLNYSSV